MQEAIDFFHLMYPEEYRVEIICMKMGKKAESKITFKAKNLTFIEAIGRVAEAAEVNIIITPGKIHLIPRKSG